MINIDAPRQGKKRKGNETEQLQAIQPHPELEGFEKRFKLKPGMIMSMANRLMDSEYAKEQRTRLDEIKQELLTHILVADIVDLVFSYCVPNIRHGSYIVLVSFIRFLGPGDAVEADHMYREKIFMGSSSIMEYAISYHFRDMWRCVQPEVRLKGGKDNYDDYYFPKEIDRPMFASQMTVPSWLWILPPFSVDPMLYRMETSPSVQFYTDHGEMYRIQPADAGSVIYAKVVTDNKEECHIFTSVRLLRRDVEKRTIVFTSY